MPIDPNDVAKSPEVPGNAEPRNCSFCHEFKTVRVTPDGTPHHEIGICNDCAIRAVVTFHNHMVAYCASLIKSNEAMRLTMMSKNTVN